MFFSTLWRYLIVQYVKVLVFCVTAFIALLLTTRMDDIAHLAGLGGSWKTVLIFVGYQIPYVLPIAMPVASLISSILLFQKLSSTHELTALRSSGYSLSMILLPIILTACYFSLFNFYVVSELATHSHLESGLLKRNLRSVNPLLLLHNKQVMRMKGIYFDALGDSKTGHYAKGVVLAIPSKSKQRRLSLFLAEELKASQDHFNGKGISFIYSFNPRKEDAQDSILIENIERTGSHIDNFSKLLQKKVWTLNYDHLELSLLILRIQDTQQSLDQAISAGSSSAEVKMLRRRLNQGYSDIVRRVSVGLSPLTFTFLGAAFGIGLARKRCYGKITLVIFFAALYLISYFSGKAFENVFITSAILYLSPHLVIMISSLLALRMAKRGFR